MLKENFAFIRDSNIILSPTQMHQLSLVDDAEPRPRLKHVHINCNHTASLHLGLKSSFVVKRAAVGEGQEVQGGASRGQF